NDGASWFANRRQSKRSDAACRRTRWTSRPSSCALFFRRLSSAPRKALAEAYFRGGFIACLPRAGHQTTSGDFLGVAAPLLLERESVRGVVLRSGLVQQCLVRRILLPPDR